MKERAVPGEVPSLPEKSSPENIANLQETVSFLQDDLKQTKSRLAAEHEQAVRLSKQTDQILNKLNREIRTQLNGIVGTLGLLQRSELQPPQDEYLSIIKDSTDNLMSMVEELLDSTKESSFRPEETPATTKDTTVETKSEPAVLQQPTKEVKPELSKSKVLIVNGLVGSSEFIEAYVLSAGIKCDTIGRGHAALKRMRQAIRTGSAIDAVFVEMVLPDMDAFEFAKTVKQDHALRHIPLILVSTFGSAERDDRALHLGFSAHIAKPVKQAQALSVLAQVLQGETPAPAQIVEPVAKSTGERTILVAEDNPVNQKVALFQLKDLGFLAKVVTNGQEVLEALENDSYDAILMDCQMPVMDGFEATNRIRAKEKNSGRHTPIIAMTAHALATDRDRCFAAGMDDYLSKPVTYEKLESVLSRWVSLGDNKEAGETQMTESTQQNETSAFAHQAAPLDISQLEEMLGPEETAEILMLFVSSTEGLLERIDTSLHNKDAKALREAAHELKGACSSVGANGMAQSCFDLEQAAKSEDWDVAPRLQSGLTESFAAAREYIQGLQS